ncbi:MAG: S1 RNA-binding domain-containing protein [Acidobacteriia bacterium]|nr:S1 RNA-binding domain-containing protein [Terriglobia bacterium]
MKLTSGVRALCLFVLQACGHARSQQTDDFKFEGGRGTPAGTLDQALGKDATSQWMEDMFGATKDGQHSHLYLLIDRLNPDLKKHALPFSLQPKPRLFEAQKIHVYRDGVEVKSLEELDRLIHALWNQWQPALPPYLSLQEPRHEGSSAKSDGGPGEAFEDDYQKHVAGLSDSARYELKLVAFAEVFDCPAPTEAFHMSKLRAPLSCEIIYREEISNGVEVIRFVKRGFAELVLRKTCPGREEYAELLFEFTERCPKLTHRVFRQMEAFNDMEETDLPEALIWLNDYVPSSPDFAAWARKVGKENLQFMPGMLGLELTDLLQPGRNPHSEIQLGAWEESPLSDRQFVTTASVWNQREAKYPVGTRIKGKVHNLSATTLFIAIEEGLDGMVSHTDESWTRSQHRKFAEVFKRGDEVEAVVVEVDKTGQRILLGLAGDYGPPA